MASVSEGFKAWKEGLTNKDSGQFAEFLTDDFQFVGMAGTRSRRQTLDWTAAGGSPTRIDNLEVLFENDDVAAIIHDAHGVTPNTGSDATEQQTDGVAMAVYTKRDGKISRCRVVRQAV